MRDYSQLRVGRFRYNSPDVQIVLLGCVVFCTVGMFSAISNLGAGGTQDVALVDVANSVLYALFAIGGIFAGATHNFLGSRLTLFIGSLGYSLYIGGLWCHQTQGNRIFVIVSGAILGLCAALLWAAQGALMMSLPMEKDKGRAFSVFWTIFNLGSVIGCSIALGITAKSTLPSLSTGIYLAFIIIMFIGSALCWTILPAEKIVRGDDRVVSVHKHPTVKEEIRGLWMVIRDWRMIALAPCFFSSNYFYAYQGAINANRFNGRTRALVGLLSAVGAIVGALLVGYLLDLLPFRRRVRGFFGLGVVLIIAIATWGGGLAFQLTFTRADGPSAWDWTHPDAVGPIILLGAYYVGDAAFQGLAYWIMGGLTNDVWRLARCAGIYKAIQSAGAAGSFGMDAVATPFLNEHLVSALLTIVSLIPAFFVIRSLSDTNSTMEEQYAVEEVALDGDRNHKGSDVAEDHCVKGPV